MWGENSAGKRVSLLSEPDLATARPITITISATTRGQAAKLVATEKTAIVAKGSREDRSARRPRPPLSICSRHSACSSGRSISSSSRSTHQLSTPSSKSTSPVCSPQIPPSLPALPPLSRPPSHSSNAGVKDKSPMTPKSSSDPRGHMGMEDEQSASISSGQQYTQYSYMEEDSRHSDSYFDNLGHHALPSSNYPDVNVAYAQEQRSMHQPSQYQQVPFQSHMLLDHPQQQLSYNLDSARQYFPGHHAQTVSVGQTPIGLTPVHNGVPSILTQAQAPSSSMLQPPRNGHPLTHSNHAPALSGMVEVESPTDPTGPASASKKKHPCPHARSCGCADTFTTSGHAARHGKKHTGEKNVQCPTCGKAFTRKDNMKQHERIHKGAGDDNSSPKASKASKRRQMENAHADDMDMTEFSQVTGNERTKMQQGQSNMTSDAIGINSEDRFVSGDYARVGHMSSMSGDLDADGDLESPGLNDLDTG